MQYLIVGFKGLQQFIGNPPHNVPMKVAHRNDFCL